MLCPFCGTYADTDDIVCPSCGKLLPRGENRDSGVMAIRQGKRAREEAASGRTPIWLERQGTGRVYVDPETRPASDGQIPMFANPEIYEADGTPLTETQGIERDRSVYGETQTQLPPVMGARSRKSRKDRPIRKHMVNWMVVLVVTFVLLILGVLGAALYLNRTPAGQRILARMGRDTSSAALWEVGEEQMNTGDMARAIENFEKAARLDAGSVEKKDANGRTEKQEQITNVSGLLMLASAYESVGRKADAETVYINLYTNVVPSATEAYTNEIRIMLSDGREAEAAELMKLAYQKTGSAIFSRQRSDLLPQLPTVDVIAGPYDQKKTIHLASPQNFDVYYTINLPDATLPADGQKYEEGIFMDEGTWVVRAVCVNGDLVSDVLTATYRISMPSPRMPRASLAPATYKQKQRVRIWPGLENMEDDDIVIYYTIDGSLPDGDSPIYHDGQPVLLPTGRVKLQAVAVNKYGKPSQTLEVNYKIEAKPWPKTAYTTADLGSVKLNSTTWDVFSKTYGSALSQEDLTMQGFENPCRRYTYSWGYATFQRVGGVQYLIELSYQTDEIKAPRGTQVGQAEDYVLSKFCDMGQVESPSGNRGLYSTGDGIGKIFFREEDGTRFIRYTAYTADSHRWQLDYELGQGHTVERIYQLYIP